MRLFSGKIPVISAEIARTLVEDGDIEAENVGEVEEDVAAILKEYLRTDRELVERTKDILEIRGLPYSQFSRVKKTVADERGFGTGEDGLDYIMQQIINIFMHSIHVEEIYSEDHELRRKMKPILRKHMSVDDEVEEEVRRKIKNMEEGSRAWDVEYQRVKEQILRKRGLTES
jgi:hypothetical protein